jgi:endonuclease-3
VAKKTSEGTAALKERISLIREILVPLWPEAKPLLDYSSCFELLCAVILSAQCTDEQVNAVTPVLFRKYPDAPAMAAAEVTEVEVLIHSVGFFRTKAKHLVQSARILTGEWGGKVPPSLEELLVLPGVGRKTANLVLSACFGMPGIIIDTHAMRVSLRLGLHDKKVPEAIEAVIRNNLAEAHHTAFSHALNRHGKHLCTARSPICFRTAGLCPLEFLCPKTGVEKSGTFERIKLIVENLSVNAENQG